MKKTLSFLLPAALLALASCSTEPSDWRPDKKVSVDMVEPGTRETDNFDQTHEPTPSLEKTPAHPQAANANTGPSRGDAVRPSDVMSADTQEGFSETPAQRDAQAMKEGKMPAAGDTARGQANAPK